MPQPPGYDAVYSPPHYIGVPGKEYSLESRRFQGIPSLAISAGDWLWAAWYAGKTPVEDHNNYIVGSSSLDRGATWLERLVIDPDGDGPVRAFDPQAWTDPDGRLWLFWAQGLDHPHRPGPSGVWAITATADSAEEAGWTAPRRLCDGVMMGKPLVLSSSKWALPVSFWHRREARSAGFVVSGDRGETWQERGACDVPPAVRDFDEHLLIERRDDSLWMLVRTRYGIGESHSWDEGNTWSPLRPSAVQHPNSRFFIRRLDSGNLLLVKHGPIERKTGRSHLAAFLSEDDGRTWSRGLMIDEREGVSYPDGQQASDGSIYVTYDYSRTGEREILLARFSEEDIRAEKLTETGSFLRGIVSKPLTTPSSCC